MRIATGLLAVVGAFFLILQVLWFAKVEVAWLPYVAHGLGAFLAGAAMVRAAPQLSLHEAFITGIVAIATLAVITWTLPKAFLLTAADPANRYTILPIVVAGSGLSCMGGAWLFRTANVTQLCLECHTETQGIGAPNTPSFHNLAQAKWRNCTTCHVMIHGSMSHPLYFR